MGKRIRPRFPRTGRPLLRRFLPGLLLALLAACCLGWFFFSGHSPGDSPGGATSPPAAGENRTETPERDAAQRDVPLSVPVSHASSGPVSGPASGPVSAPTSERENTIPPSSSAPPYGGGTAPDASDVVGAALEELSRATPALPPYADASLSEIAAELAARHANRKASAWGEHLPGVTSRLAAPDGRGPIVALTLDACGGRKGASYDADLIAFLRENSIPATLFLTSLWMRTNPDILAELAADPLFEIAAHGARHRPCSINGNSVYGIKGTASFAELVAEVEGNARDIERATGKRPGWFRSGTAYYDDIAVSVIRDLGLGIAGYSITGDEGATLPASVVAARVLRAGHGDIVLCHMNKPASGTREGLKKALPALLDRGTIFMRLSDMPKDR